MNKKIFLSIVVPCYNSGEYLESLLQSIVDCNMNDIEVILADDCSPVDYQDHVNKFLNKLNIKQCKTKKNSGNPTNARELGVTFAEGLYLTFLDHDDKLIPEGIQEWKKIAVEKNYPDYIVCGFRQCDMNDNLEYEKYGYLDFLHGKFFKLDEFYRKCNIHFDPIIFHKEDTWVLAQVNCNCIKYNIEPVFTNFCTHIWHNNEKSLSHQIDAAERKGDIKVTIEREKTLIRMSYEIYFKFFDEGYMPYPVAREWFIRQIIGSYFDMELNHDALEYLLPSLIEWYQDTKNRLSMDTEDIIDFSYGRVFSDELSSFREFAHPYFEWKETFIEFLNLLDMNSKK